jgi:hypothetical protein
MGSFPRALWMSLVLGLALLIAARAAATSAGGDIEKVLVCNGHSAQTDGCVATSVLRVDPQGRVIWLNAAVRIAGEKAPMAVFIKAFAASAVSWDGRLIGRNGRPASSAALEVPGLRDAVIAIPSELSGPGKHRLQIEMSTMRAPLRLETPVLGVSVAPFEAALQPALRHYIPALLTAGGMLIVILCLGFLAWKQRRFVSLGALTCAATFATGQLAAESFRAFVPLLYPAQIVRLELVLLCACGFGLSLAAYLAQRFGTARRKWILAAQTALMVSAVFLLGGLDAKVAGVVLSSAAVCAVICAIAAAQKKPGAVPILGMLCACACLGLFADATFLDRDFYVWALVLFAMLLAQEAQGIGAVHRSENADSAELVSLWLGSGQKRHLVPPDRIVRLAAADDYTEVFIAGAAAVLHPEPLHKLLERLPPTFVRVHRSHAVNLAHLESLRRGSRSSVTLSDQSVAPVSRRCLPKLVAAISG